MDETLDFPGFGFGSDGDEVRLDGLDFLVEIKDLVSDPVEKIKNSLGVLWTSIDKFGSDVNRSRIQPWFEDLRHKIEHSKESIADLPKYLEVGVSQVKKLIEGSQIQNVFGLDNIRDKLSKAGMEISAAGVDMQFYLRDLSDRIRSSLVSSKVHEWFDASANKVRVWTAFVKDKATELRNHLPALMDDAANSVRDATSKMGGAVSTLRKNLFGSEVPEWFDKAKNKVHGFKESLFALPWWLHILTGPFDFLTSKVTGLVAALSGVAGLYAIIHTGEQVEERIDRIANITGSESFGRGFDQWVKRTSNELPVLRQQLHEFGAQMASIGFNATQFDVKGAVAAGFGEVGQSFDSAIRAATAVAKGEMDPFQLRRQFLALPVDIVRELYNTIPGIQGFQERFNIVMREMAKSYGDTVERMKHSSEFLRQTMKNVFTDFREAIAGDQDSGPFGSLKSIFAGFVHFLEHNRSTIIQIGHDIGSVLTDIIRSISHIAGEFFKGLSIGLTGAQKDFVGFEKDIIRPMTLNIRIWAAEFANMMGEWAKGFGEDLPRYAKALEGAFNIVAGIISAINKGIGLAITGLALLFTAGDKAKREAIVDLIREHTKPGELVPDIGIFDAMKILVEANKRAEKVKEDRADNIAAHEGKLAALDRNAKPGDVPSLINPQRNLVQAQINKLKSEDVIDKTEPSLVQKAFVGDVDNSSWDPRDWMRKWTEYWLGGKIAPKEREEAFKNLRLAETIINNPNINPIIHVQADETFVEKIVQRSVDSLLRKSAITQGAIPQSVQQLLNPGGAGR